MALFEQDSEDDLMPIVGAGVDTYWERDEEDDLMPRVEPPVSKYPNPIQVTRGVVYGPDDSLVGLRGNVQFTSTPKTTEEV